ncbi:MAG TPA: GvpL/GvpF family gas vesicle protein, partial [Chloroflexota bacterium]
EGGGDHLLYLYAIFIADAAFSPDADAAQIPGLDPAEDVFVLEAAGLSAALSRVPANQFAEGPLNAALADLGSLAPLAVRHEEVVRALYAEHSALIPMSFGAIYRSAEAITQLLSERADELRALLRALDGKVEWSVKVYIDPADAVAAARSMSPGLRALGEEANAAAPGRAYLLRKRIEQLSADEADHVVDEAIAVIFDRLSALSAQTQVDELPQQPAVTLGTRQLVAQAAFLVDVGQQEAFQESLANLESAHAALGLSVELTGPWAPYSFVRAVRG